MKREELDAIRKRAEAATPGPWYWEDDLDETEMPSLVTANDEGVMHFGDCEQFYPAEGDPPNAYDAEFIAYARQDVPALLAEVERLRGVQKRLSNGYVSLFVNYLELLDDVIPDWREVLADDVKNLSEALRND